MPSVIVKDLPLTITSLTDKQLFNKLRSYNPNIGPVLPTTRTLYQRKLYALETGQHVEPHSNLPPVDNDESEEDQTQSFLPSSLRSLPAGLLPWRRSLPDAPDTVPARRLASPTYDAVPEPPQPRQRTTVMERRDKWEERSELRRPSPRKPLHPEMGDYTRVRTPNMTKRVPTATKTASAARKQTLRVPVWVIVMAIIVIAFFIFLIIRNMETEPVSSIPDEIEMDV